MLPRWGSRGGKDFRRVRSLPTLYGGFGACSLRCNANPRPACTIMMMMPDPPSRNEANGIDDISYLKAAFKWQYNLIGMGGALAFAVVSASGLPLILGAGLELIYLAAVPQMARFQRVVRSWHYAEEKKGS